MKRSKRLCCSLAIAASLSLLLGGCGDKKEAPKKPAPKSHTSSTPPGNTSSQMPTVSEADMKTAREYFASYCSTCHGKEGKGDGVAGAALKPKPRNFHDPEWRKTATWERVHKVITKGGAAAGLSPLMAPAPLYQDKPGVLNGLTKLVLEMGK